MTTLLLSRRGRFCIHEKVFVRLSEAELRRLFDGVFVTRCEMRWDRLQFEYHAISQHFEPCDEGVSCTTYEPLITPESVVWLREGAMEAARKVHWAIKLRFKLLVPSSSRWNACMRSFTGWLERRFPREK